MTTFDFLFSDVMAQRLGWVLVHFVWQGAAIAILLASLLAFMKNASSSAKYTVACGGLLLMACAPVVTMMLVEVETAYVFEAAPMVESTYEPMEFADTTAPEPIVYEQIAEPLVIDLPAVPLKDRLIAQLEGSLGYIVMAWALGVFALSLWHLGGWTQVTRLRKRMVKPVEGELKAKMLQLASAIGVDRGVELLESALVAVPTVVGWLRPVILLPASAISGLSSEQLEAILAHELAHIKRCDWLVNVFQVVIETLGFYHPAVWWVSNRIRAERENCCDDVAVSVTGDRLQYARALTEMEELRHNGVFAIAATGGSLLDRIRRLLGRDSDNAKCNGWAIGAMLAMVIIAIAMPVAFAMSSSTADDTAKDIETDAAGKYVVTLDNGATVELLGLCEHPSDGNLWFDADGMILTGDLPEYRRSSNRFQDGEDWLNRQIAFRFSGDGVERMQFRWRMVGADSPTWFPFWSNEGQREYNDQQNITFRSLKDRQAVDIKIGVAVGEWKFTAGLGNTECQTNDNIKDRTVVLINVEEKDGVTSAIIAHGLGEMATRLVAIDGAGQKIEGLKNQHSGSDDIASSTYTFKLPLAEIIGFELQARPFEWAEFKDVSLRPTGDNDDISAADLVRSVRASENWVHNIDSLYLRLDIEFAGLSDEAFAKAQKQHEMMKPGMPGMMMPGMGASLPNREASTRVVEIAFDSNRLREFSESDKSIDLRTWDGKQMSSHYKHDEFDTNLYVLKDKPQRSFKYMMLHMEWFRSQPHVFWWNGENEVWPMSYFGNADEFEIVGQENYRGIDCYVLVGDLATSGLSWKWYVGKNDKLLYGKIRLRHGKPDVESWMLDYKEVAPGCLIPMTQGRQSYKWNEAGTSYYISGPYDLKVAQVRVNEKLEDSLFEMEFVHGVNVQDQRDGVILEYPYSAKVVDWPLEFRKAIVSASNLRDIGLALFTYAMDHDDKFPSKLDELVEKADLSPKTFESPRKPEDFDGPSYIYITGQAGTSNPNNVIVYENPEYLQKNSDKINVLYCDGHVEAVTADNLINQLRATYKRLDRDVSAVDNLRWADTADEAKAAHVKQERMLSFSRLKKLGLAAILFAEDNDRKLPDKVDDMEPYLATEEIIEWISENVEYVGAGKTSIDDRPGEVVIAYDRSMFEANGYGTMVVYVNGRVEFIGNKRLGQLGIFGNGGEIRFGERIGIMLNSDDGLVACKSVEFKREGEFVTAVVGMDVVSRPRGGWDVVLQLLDAQGNEVRSVAERFENSRKTSGAIFVGPQEITFTLGKFSEIEKAVRFKLSIIAADWVKIETRFYLWPADDETVDTFLRTEIFVDEDGQELSEDQIGSGQFSADLSDDNVRQFKELIAELPDGKWLANPKVTVLDTEPARISVTKQRN